MLNLDTHILIHALRGALTANERRGDLSNFKGDQEQADDMTLVVARLR